MPRRVVSAPPSTIVNSLTPATPDPGQTQPAAAPAAGSGTSGDGRQPYQAPEGAPDLTSAPRTHVDPIPHLMPFGSISTLSGAAGVGKTAFLATFIRSMLDGEPIFDLPTNTPPAIGLIVCDRPWRDHSMWFNKAGCPDLPHISLRDIEDYQWALFHQRNNDKIPALFGQLVDQLNLPPGSFLIVDPLPLFIPGRLIDYKDVAMGMGHLDQQLHKRQLTMLGVCHVGKQKANKNDRYMRPQDRILGSTALIGYSETAFYLLSPDEAEQDSYQFGAIPHQLPPLTLNYKRNALGLFVPADALDDVEGEMQAFECLPAMGISIASSTLYATIQRALGCSRSTAARLVQRLVSDGRVKRLGRGLYERAKPS